MKYLSLISFLVFAGCSQLLPQQIVIDQPTQETVKEPPVQLEMQEEVVEKIDIRIKEIMEENSASHYTLEVRYPQFIAPGNRFVSQINERVDKVMRDSIDFFVDQVVSYEIDDSFFEEGFGSSYIADPRVMFLSDQQIVSIISDESQYTAGAAHPYGYISTMNFDVTTGTLIELDDLFTGDYVPALSDLSIQYLTIAAEYPDMYWIEEGAGPDVANFQTFSLTEDSLVIHFNPYQVAAYAAGILTVEIPYSDLEEFIDASGPLGHLGYST